MNREVRDTLILRTRDAVRVVESLERCATLAYAHTTTNDAQEIAECLTLIETQAKAARERIALRGVM